MKEKKTVAIATLNSWKCEGNYQQRLALMADQLAPADIVALQESYDSDEDSTAEYLAKALSYGVLIEKARSKSRWLDGRRVYSSSGLALLSRWPLLAVERLALPSVPEDGERIAMIATCATPFGAIALVNTHLSHLPGVDDLRREQLETIIERMRHRTAGAFFLCGDLNADPRSPPISYLAELPDYTARDACATCENRFSTLVGSSRRIDYIFLLQRGSQFSFVEARRIADQPHNRTGTLPSDHYGVMAAISAEATTWK